MKIPFRTTFKRLLEKLSYSDEVKEAEKQLMKAKNQVTEICQQKSKILLRLSTIRSDIHMKRTAKYEMQKIGPSTRTLERDLLFSENEHLFSLKKANMRGLASMDCLTFAINSYYDKEKRHTKFVKKCYTFLLASVIIGFIATLWPKIKPRPEQTIKKQPSRSYFQRIYVWALSN